MIAERTREAASSAVAVADRAEDLSVEVFTSLKAAEAAWRRLEATAVLTPYQRFDWIEALVATGVELKGRFAIAVVSLGTRPVALLPLVIERANGIAQGSIIGSRRSNSDWMIVDPDAAMILDQATLSRVFAQIRRQTPALDLLSFSNLPQSWQGIANPLMAFDHVPAPNNLYFAVIGPTPAPYIEHRLNQKRRANIRRGARRLEEMFGKVELRRANDPAELAKVHAAFLRQRGERFDQMGVDNIFASEQFVRVLQDSRRTVLQHRRPALVFHALYAGDEIVATSCGAFAGSHYSQYINSTASGPASKYSLMGVLMAELCDELNRVGVVTHDMGIGDFEYKTDWTEPQAIYNSVVPVTARGRLLLPILRAATGLRRAIKQNPVLWPIAQRLMKARYAVMKRLRGR